MSNFAIRLARPDDIEAILALDEQLFATDMQWDATMDPRWTRSDDGLDFFNERIAGRGGALWVAEGAEGAVVGFLVGGLLPAACYRKLAQVAELEAMFVAPAARAQGIGGALVATFVRWAQTTGAPRLRVLLTAQNVPAQKLYARYGFAPFELAMERPT